MRQLILRPIARVLRRNRAGQSDRGEGEAVRSPCAIDVLKPEETVRIRQGGVTLAEIEGGAFQVCKAHTDLARRAESSPRRFPPKEAAEPDQSSRRDGDEESHVRRRRNGQLELNVGIPVDGDVWQHAPAA